MSKILEKTVFLQLNKFISENNILDSLQSGFRANHSTETALTKILNDLRNNMDDGLVSVLVLLDLSAAFDTVDHNILLHRLEHTVGITGTALNWIRSYITGRTFCVRLGDSVSGKHTIPFGVAQGSNLAPLLFSLYMLPLGDIIRKHNINYHSYADDTQLYISVNPHTPDTITSLTSCLTEITKWMNANLLKLNENKTEVLLVGPKQKRDDLMNSLGHLAAWVKPQVTSLGVIIDSDLNFTAHFNKVTKIAFFHLRNIAKVRPFLSQPDAEKIIHAFITSRLDYCNALFTGLPKKAIDRLQLIQNSAARLLTKTKKREHITPVLYTLHWLPVSNRIDFKVLLMVYKSLNSQGPAYITDFLPSYTPSRSLRSSTAGLLDIDKIKKPKKKIGEAAFFFYAIQLWNTLPQDIREASSTNIFKNRLKTNLFRSAFSQHMPS